jgi:hypothetical protein
LSANRFAASPEHALFQHQGMQMLRFIILICTLVVAPAAADAQQARDRLDGFNGVPFGTTFEQAKQALGSTAKLSTKAASGGRKLNMLSVDLTLDGQIYMAGYIFGSGDLMTLARITPHGVALGKDKDVCLQVGTKMLTTLVRQYGTPNSEKKDTYTRTLVFNFKDGNEIEAVSSFSIFCATFASYRTPQGKND